MLAALCGAAAGAANGLLGAGGGMLLLPLLRKAGLARGRALFGSALAIMLPISTVSCLIYLLRDASAISPALPYCAGGLLGGLLGAVALRRAPVIWLHRALGVLILWGGLRMLR